MHAALVTAFDRPPAWTEVPESAPEGDEVVVTVRAAALHPRVRSQASGSHYTSDGALPLVPGIDGVGDRADGSLVYFVLPDTRRGSFAERTAIDLRRSVILPRDIDATAIAAAMNPAMSSWVALRRRAGFEPGQSVLVLGATGSAGRLAVQVATHLGASRVVAAGRDPETLAALAARGAHPVSIAGAPEAAAAVGDAAADVDVVLDYLWGEPAARAMRAVLLARRDRGARLTWVQIGAVAGAESPIPSELLRSANLAIVGSGQGSVSTRGIVDELSELVPVVAAHALELDVRARPLREVASVWTEPTGGGRVVFVP
jgi:NADPH:quinone reductase-like Zn-dependent oxidoreductase